MSEGVGRRNVRMALITINAGVVGWEILYYLQGRPLGFVIWTGLASAAILNLTVWLTLRRKRAREAKARDDART